MNQTTEPLYDYSDIDVFEEQLIRVNYQTHCSDAACVITAILTVLIFLLGITGNGAVIWITGFKMKKSVNTTWYLSLALSDFIFCATLPLTISLIVTRNWTFGLFMCKFTSLVMNINMYSSIFIMVFISVDRCVTVKMPVWAQNNRTVKKASLVVALVWLASALLSVLSAKFRTITENSTRVTCYNDINPHQHITIVLVRFTCGFLLPFLAILTCYCILIAKLRANQMSKSTKPYKIMTSLIATFFICWLPFQITSFVELGKTGKVSDVVFIRAQQMSVTLACANSFMNPILYAFMAKDVKKCYSFLSRIESAIDEETRSTNAEDNRLSIAV